MAQKSNTIKCKWCDWETTIWARLKNGKPQSGWMRLYEHIIREHEEHGTEAENLIADFKGGCNENLDDTCFE